jgi:hypothetical protein
MDARVMFAVVLSGALVIELSHGGMPHGEYNVPAPTVTVATVGNATNVAQVMVVPMNYQTRAQPNVILEVKG